MKNLITIISASLLFTACLENQAENLTLDQELVAPRATQLETASADGYGPQVRHRRMTSLLYYGDDSVDSQLYTQILNSGTQATTFIVTYMTMGNRVLRTQRLHAEPGERSERLASGYIFPENDRPRNRIKIRVQALFSDRSSDGRGTSRDVSFGLYDTSRSSSNALIGMRALGNVMMPIVPDDAP